MHHDDRGDGSWPPLTATRRSLLVEGSDREFRSFVESMVLFASRLQDVRAKLAAHMQVSPPQYRILMVLARAETPEMTATTLAATLEVSTAFIVTEAQKLGDKRLVTRRRNPDDARSFLIALSALGRERVLAAAPLMCAVNDTLFASLDRAQMLELARKTQELLEAASDALDLFEDAPKTAVRVVRRGRRSEKA